MSSQKLWYLNAARNSGCCYAFFIALLFRCDFVVIPGGL